MIKERPIGIFDSGVGGLTVLKRVSEMLPNEHYLYFGDTARIPYGEKSRDQLFSYVREILNWYKAKKVKAVLMACNTSSAVVLDSIKKEYDFPVIGLIEPAAKYLASTGAKKIGLIATSATVNSKAYTKALLNLAPEKEIYEVACPGLVEIVENNAIKTNEAYHLVKKYVDPLIDNKVDKIILGCTHYPYLSEVINSIVKRDNMLVDPAKYLAQEIKDILEDLNLLNEDDTGSKQYYVTANPDKFVQSGSKFFAECDFAQEIDLSLLQSHVK